MRNANRDVSVALVSQNFLAGQLLQKSFSVHIQDEVCQRRKELRNSQKLFSVTFHTNFGIVFVEYISHGRKQVSIIVLFFLILKKIAVLNW